MDPVRNALLEDGAFRDISSAIIPNRRIRGRFLAKQDLVVCGMELAKRAFYFMGVSFSSRVRDGQTARKGAALARGAGPPRGFRPAKRPVLNFAQQLPGGATRP